MYRFIFVMLMLLVAAPVLAERTQVALVIGNAAYQSVPALRNPRNDAEDISRALEEIGFDVSVALDSDQVSMLRSLRSFQTKARDADVSLIFYAGHGMEVGKQNYLIPTDATLNSDRDLPFEAIKMDDLVFAASGASELSLVILDACRNNPFARKMEQTTAYRSVGRGLAAVEPQGNTIVAYSAKAGTIAADGAGRNSPYAEALLGVLEEPNVEVGLLFRRVRDKVIEATRGRQEPFWYGSLSSKELYLNATVQIAPTQPKLQPEPPIPLVAAPQIAPVEASLREQALVWESIKDSADPALLKLFKDRYPGSTFSEFAALKLQELSKRPNKASASAPPDRGAAQNSDSAMKPYEPAQRESVQKLDVPATRPVPGEIKAENDGSDVTQTAPVTMSSVLKNHQDQPPLSPKPLSRDQIREVQIRLTVAGFRPGVADGIMGARTRGAIEAYETQIGWNVSGKATDDLLVALRAAISDEDVAAFRARREAELAAARRAAAAAAAASQATQPQPTLSPAATPPETAPAMSDAEARRAAAKARREARRAKDPDDSGGSSSGGGGPSRGNSGD